MKYGCHSKPRLAGCFARLSFLWIKDVMSKECQYDKRATDAKCEGCGK